MDGQGRKDAKLKTLLAAALDGTLTDRQAEQLAGLNSDLVKLVLLAATKRIAEQDARIAELQAKLEGPAKIDPATPDKTA